MKKQDYLDAAVNRATAFRSWGEMREVMAARGYVPTLRAWTKDGATIAKQAEAEGFQVFWIAE
jgi:hypothetical protein